MRPAALLPVILASCVGAPPPPQDAAPGILRLAPAGLDVAGTGLEIGFGRARDGAVAAAARVLGRPPDRVARADCAGRVFEVVHWTGAVSMHVREGAFLGWTAPPDTTLLTDDRTPPALRAGETCRA